MSRPPHGGTCPLGVSPPSRGAWIEILDSEDYTAQKVMSPPSRGAWIEIWRGSVMVTRLTSPPSRGAWIEIVEVRVVPTHFSRRPPRGGRGLK